eukprot:Filipodium_phascolosomae@DN1885_c0_g1_i3.p1
MLGRNANTLPAVSDRLLTCSCCLVELEKVSPLMLRWVKTFEEYKELLDKETIMAHAEQRLVLEDYHFMEQQLVAKKLQQLEDVKQRNSIELQRLQEHLDYLQSIEAVQEEQIQCLKCPQPWNNN